MIKQLQMTSFLTGLPKSLNFQIEEDDLYQILLETDVTKDIAKIRAKEIIVEIIRGPIQKKLILQIADLEKQIENQNAIFNDQMQKHLWEQSKKQKEKQQVVDQMKSEYDQEVRDLTLRLNQKQQELGELEQELDAISGQKQNLVVEKEAIEQKLREQTLQNYEQASSIESLNQHISKLQGECDLANKQMQRVLRAHQNSMNKSKGKADQFQHERYEMTQKINSLEMEIQEIKNALQDELKLQSIEKEKLSKQLKKVSKLYQSTKKDLLQSEQSYQILKKQIQVFKTKYRQFESDISKFKFKSQEQNKSKQQKIENIQERYDKLKLSLQQAANSLKIQRQKVKRQTAKIQKLVLPLLSEVRRQQNLLRSFVYEKVNLLTQYCSNVITQIVNHFSAEFSEYFQECIFEIKESKNKLAITKQELKIKSEIIEYLDKALNSESKSVYELRAELKLKKKQEEKLRKKLKTHYEETDKKLETFQSKYLSILQNQH